MDIFLMFSVKSDTSDNKGSCLSNIAGQTGFSGGKRKSDIENVKNNAGILVGGMYLRAPDGTVAHMSVKNARTASAKNIGRIIGRMNKYGTP